jgi:hypothetical protein
MEEGDRRRKPGVRFTTNRKDGWGGNTMDTKEGWRSMIMKRAIIPLVLSLLFSPFGHGQALIYSWRDNAGKLHIVDELNKVPVEYREEVKRKELRFQAPSRTITTVRDVEGEKEKTSGEERFREEMEEGRSSITDLRDRLEILRREREMKRIRMIRKRGRGKTVYRERGEIERIDREIEIYADQLEKKTEALRSLEEEKSRKGRE